MNTNRTSLWTAVTPVAAGVILLLQHSGVPLPMTLDWWALFLLIAAVAAWAHTWTLNPATGHGGNPRVAGAL